MTALHRGTKAARAACDACACSIGTFLRDTGRGLIEIGHSTLALVGLTVVASAILVGGRDDLRHAIETHTLGWLQARHGAVAAAPTGKAEAALVAAAPATTGTPRVAATGEAVTPTPAPAPAVAPGMREGDAVSRATASDPKELTRQQSAVAHWLARRYRVAPEPISRLVKEAWNVAPRFGLDPTLILAVMAIESSFNPFAQSPVGAQGLMQVMTSVHNGKYERFGGTLAAFDPVTNLKVGVQVLRECIARAGSVEAGLRQYVGAANLPDDGGYAGKVLAEQDHLRNVAGGKLVAANTRSVARAPAAPAAAPARRPAGGVPALPAMPAAPQDTDAPVVPADGIREPQQLALARFLH